MTRADSKGNGPAGPVPPEPGEDRTDQGDEEQAKPRSWLVRWLTLVLLFLSAAGLDAATQYFGFFEPAAKLANIQAILGGAGATFLFGIVAAMAIVSLLLKARLLFYPARASKTGVRWATLLVGLPLLGAATLLFDLSAAGLAEARAEHAAAWIDYLKLAGSAGLWVLALDIFAVLSRYGGHIKRGAAMAKAAIRLLPLALASALAIGLARHYGHWLLAVPALGALLRPALTLGLLLASLRLLTARVRVGAPVVKPPGASLISSVVMALAAVVLAGLPFLVPKPRQALGSAEAPPVVPPRAKTSFQYDDRDNKKIIVTDELKVILTSVPFGLDVLDHENNVLLRLCNDAEHGDSHRGVALTRELQSATPVEAGGETALLGARLRLFSSPLLRLGRVRAFPEDEQGKTGAQAKNEIVATGMAGDASMAVTLDFYSDDIMRIKVEADQFTRPLNRISISFLTAAWEHKTGLGGDGTGIGRSGSAFSLNVGQGPGSLAGLSRLAERLSGGRYNLRAGAPANDWPAPYLYLSRGLGLFLAEASDPRVDAGKTYPDVVRFSGKSRPIELYVITGADHGEVLSKFHRLTGRKPYLGPDAAMPWIDAPAPLLDAPDEVGGAMAGVRSRGLPAGNIIVRVAPGERVADLDSDDRLVIRNSVSRARSLGFDAHFQDYALLKKGTPECGRAVRDKTVVMNRMGLPLFTEMGGASWAMVDFSNPKALDRAAARWRARMEDGFSGIVLDGRAVLPADALLFNGESGQAMRNLFPLLYARAAREALGNDAVIAARGGAPGMGRYINVLLPPDIGGVAVSDSDPADHVNRLVNLSISAAPPSGPPAFSRPLKATAPMSERESDLARLLMTAGAFSPVWMLPPPSPGMADSAPGGGEGAFESRLGRLRGKYFPHLLSQARLSLLDGRPLLRPLWTLRPEDDDLYREADQFMLGSGLIVAPATGLKGGKKTVIFPEGRWLDLEGNRFYSDVTTSVQTKDGMPLLFLGEGELLPTFDGGFETLIDASDRSVKTGSLGGDIALSWIFGPPAELTLFDGTRVAVSQAADTILFRVAGNSERSYSLRVFDAPLPLALFVDDMRIGERVWEYSDITRILELPPTRGPGFKVEVIVRGDE